VKAAYFPVLCGLLSGCDATDTLIAVWRPEPLLAAFYFEAEDGLLSGPLEIGSDAAASGGEFVVAAEPAQSADAPGTGRALYDLGVEQPGEHVIWARIHSPGPANNRFWFRVDEGAWVLWRISTGEAWFWDDLHDGTDYGTALSFQLEAGTHRLEIASAVTGAELDRFYVTVLGDRPPGDTTPCDPPPSIEVMGECRRSCGSYGDVSCDPALCAGREELDAYDCGVCCLLE
jgi:hypothetical protein